MIARWADAIAGGLMRSRLGRCYRGWADAIAAGLTQLRAGLMCHGKRVAGARRRVGPTVGIDGPCDGEYVGGGDRQSPTAAKKRGIVVGSGASSAMIAATAVLKGSLKMTIVVRGVDLGTLIGRKWFTGAEKWLKQRWWWWRTDGKSRRQLRLQWCWWW